MIRLLFKFKFWLFIIGLLLLTAYAKGYATTSPLKFTHSMSAHMTKKQVMDKPKPKFADESRPILLQQGKDKQLVIYLQSNATTGYSWFLTDHYPAAWLKPVSRQFIAPSLKLMGAAGYEKWVFQVLPAAFAVQRVAHIVFSYARPWEAGSGSRMRLTLYVVPKS